RTTAIMDTLLAVADELTVTPQQAALAWLMRRGPIPIIGPRTMEQLQDNLGAPDVSLTPAQLARLDASSAIVLGYPDDFLAADAQRLRLAGGDLDRVEAPDRPPG